MDSRIPPSLPPEAADGDRETVVGPATDDDAREPNTGRAGPT